MLHGIEHAIRGEHGIGRTLRDLVGERVRGSQRFGGQVRDEIERLRLDKGREGFVVRDPLEGPATSRLASIRGFWIVGVPMYDAEQQRLMAGHRFIPIDPFAYLLRNGALPVDPTGHRYPWPLV